MGSIPPDHQHNYGSWFNSGTCQRRQCECGQTETRDHDWTPWETDHYYRGSHGEVHTRPSVKQKRKCNNCQQEETQGGW